MKLRNALITALFLLSIQTVAQQQGEKQFLNFTLGAGVALKTNIRFDNQKDDSDKPTIIRPIPFATLQIGPVRITGPAVTVSLWSPTPWVRPYLTLTRFGERYYGPGMERRLDSWFAGGGVSVLFFDFNYIADVQGRSHGDIFSASIAHRIMAGPIFFRPAFTVIYHDENYTDYHYGVLPSEVTATRAEYNPGSSLSYRLGFISTYSLNDNWKIFTNMGYTILGSPVKNSPTVRTDKVFNLISAIYYQF